MHKINEIKIYTLMSTKITNMQQLLFLLCDIVNVSRNIIMHKQKVQQKIKCDVSCFTLK